MYEGFKKINQLDNKVFPHGTALDNNAIDYEWDSRCACRKLCRKVCDSKHKVCSGHPKCIAIQEGQVELEGSCRGRCTCIKIGIVS